MLSGAERCNPAGEVVRKSQIMQASQLAQSMIVIGRASAYAHRGLSDQFDDERRVTLAVTFAVARK